VPQPRPAALTSLETLIEANDGELLWLPPQLSRGYGNLCMPLASARPWIYSNFVSTLDGVVSFQVKGHAGGGDISGFSAQDRMVMGLLRAVADAVIVGSGALAADRRHIWTAGFVFPRLAREYRRLREALGKRRPPLNVIVTGSGHVDLRLPVFASGEVPALIITTRAGAKRLCTQRIPDSVEIRAARARNGLISAKTIIEEVCRAGSSDLVLVEGGPQLLGHFYAERILDEQFLTLAPQIVGRRTGDRRLSLVMATAFAPRNARWGILKDVRAGESLLFLRYSFRRS
jgi:riboflavin biosynthesis pyrimidine reductase